jgi:hypothetical protein
VDAHVILPDWNSLAGTNYYTKLFTYAGFFALFMLGVFEVLAYVYSTRNETLRETPRHLSEAEKTKLRMFLSDKEKGEMTINSLVYVKDAKEYADEIAALFHDDMGWTTRVRIVTTTGVDTSGMWITIHDANYISPAAMIICFAFVEAQIPIRPVFTPDPNGPAQNEVWLTIGSKN